MGCDSSAVYRRMALTSSVNVNSDAHFGILRMSKLTEFKMVREICTCVTATLLVAASKSKSANIAVDTTHYCFFFFF